MSIKSALKKEVKNLPPVPVDLESVDVTVHIRPPTDAEFQEYEELLSRAIDPTDKEVSPFGLRRGLVMAHLVEEDGSRLYEDDDMEEFSELPHFVVREIFEALTSPELLIKGARGNSRKTGG